MIDPTIQEIHLNYWVHWQYSKNDRNRIAQAELLFGFWMFHTLLCCWTQHYGYYLVTELVSRH
jgi:hypothetical protein